MSQIERYPKTTPTFKRNDDESKVLREKQLGSVTGKTTPLQKTIRTTSLKSKINATDENKSVASTRIPFKLTPKNLPNKSKPSNLLHLAHLSSHNNEVKLSTPVNRNIRSAFGSALKQESTSKENSARLHLKY